MQIGTILKRGATTIEVVGVDDVKKAVRVKYHEYPDMEIKEWYSISMLRRCWEEL